MVLPSPGFHWILGYLQVLFEWEPSLRSCNGSTESRLSLDPWVAAGIFEWEPSLLSCNGSTESRLSLHPREATGLFE